MSAVAKAKKAFPVFHSDEEAERFVATADLSDYDFSGFRPVSFPNLKRSTRAEDAGSGPRLDLTWFDR